MIDACGVIRSHPLLSQAWNVNVFPVLPSPLQRGICYLQSCRTAHGVRVIYHEICQMDGVKEKEWGVRYVLGGGDMTGWRIRYSHRNPWTPAVTLWSLHGHGAPLLHQLHTWNGPSLCTLNKGRCEYERRGVKYITSNKIRKERRKFLDKSWIKLVGMKAAT